MPYKFVKNKYGEYEMKPTLDKNTVVCVDCKARRATRFCEQRLTGVLSGRLCNLPLCEFCATEIEPGTKVCKTHAERAGVKPIYTKRILISELK